MSETKLETFQRLFPPRAAKVLDALRVAAHCMKPHMEADATLTDQFVRDVREAMDVFPPLGDDVVIVSIPGLDDPVDDTPPANCYVLPTPDVDDDDGTVTIRKSEHDRLKALELDRAKVAYGLSQLSKLNPEPGSKLKRIINLIRDGIGRKELE